MNTRRGFLAAGAGTLAALAGCVGGGGQGGGDGDGDGDGGGDGGSGSENGATGTPTGTPTTRLADHPAAAGIETQPRLGPPVSEATAVVVAFEDPSCTLCRRFEENTLPDLRTNLVDPGDAAFVYRGYPIIYPWGEPATQALESTYAASEDAFWALKDHYFAEQGSFDTENVLEETESFLASGTDVDAASVVNDARNRRHDDAVQADIDAARAAGAGSQTPIFYLFRDGEFRTRVSGPQGYDVFAAALGF
jgi:protein-disulfide isomerase